MFLEILSGVAQGRFAETMNLEIVHQLQNQLILEESVKSEAMNWKEVHTCIHARGRQETNERKVAQLDYVSYPLPLILLIRSLLDWLRDDWWRND